RHRLAADSGPALVRRRRRRAAPRPAAPALEPLESRRLLATFTVNSTADVSNPPPGVMTLRQAIAESNAASPGPNQISFNIDSQMPGQPGTPNAGFDPGTQTWTITLDGGLPELAISTPVDIDGFSQAHGGIPYLYPVDFSSQAYDLAVDASVTGGTYQLS